MKTSELTGPALDWAVAMANNETYEDYRVIDDSLYAFFCGAWLDNSYSPSTDWAQGGPIIEREKISLDSPNKERGITTIDGCPSWFTKLTTEGPFIYASGPTPLIAAMRCYVASKLGPKVDIPEELL